MFTLLLGIGHFTWSTATERDELGNPITLMGVGAALVDRALGLISLKILLDRVAMFIYGNGDRIIESVATTMEKFSQLLSNLSGKGKFLNNMLERQIVNKLFLTTSNITRVIQICFVGLAALGAALAAYDLYQAVLAGDIGDIVFSSINMLLATVALGVSIASFMGLSIAGPLGIIIAVVGILVAIAQWIYGLLKKPSISISPIAEYTRDYIRDRKLEYGNIGSYLCRATSFWNGSMVCEFDVKTMNTDWDKINHIVDRQPSIYTEAGALVTSSRNDRVYNFANIQSAAFGNTSTFFSTGAINTITGWQPDSDLRTCQHAVECQSINGRAAAIFLVIGSGSSYPRAFLTSNLEDAPRSSNELNLGMEWQEHPLDVVAINGLEDTMFLIFTTRHIYQVRDGVIRKIISDFVGEAGASLSSGSLYALALSTNINLIYRMRGIQTPDLQYHYLLTQDGNGDYSSMKLLRTINMMMASPCPIVGRFFKKTEELVARMDFIFHDGNSYARYGAILSDSDDAAMSLHNGVKFQVPDNGFGFFYKNAFIPK